MIWCFISSIDASLDVIIEGFQIIIKTLSDTKDEERAWGYKKLGIAKFF